MRKLRPLFAVTLAVCMCLNSTVFAAVSTAAESPADNGSDFLFSEEFEHLDPAIWTVSSGTWGSWSGSWTPSLPGLRCLSR